MWSEDDQSVLKTTLDIEPDIEPCNLAVICRKPCFEVYFSFQTSFSSILFILAGLSKAPDYHTRLVDTCNTTPLQSSDT